MVEWISLVNEKCPFNSNHKLKKWNNKSDKEKDKKLFYCCRCDLIFQKKRNNNKKSMKRLFRFEMISGKKKAGRIFVTENSTKKFHIRSLFILLSSLNK